MVDNQQEASTSISISDKEEIMPSKDFFGLEHIKARFLDAYQNEPMARKALSCITVECTKTPALAECTKISLIQAGLDAAHFGLVPNKQAGHAFLIPYNNKKTKRKEAQLQIGYKGYIKKFDEEGWSVEVELVSKQEILEERFIEIRGTQTQIMHKPLRNQIINEDSMALAYAIAKKIGREPIPVVMTLDEIMEVGKTQVWQDGENGAKGKYVMGLKGVWVSEDRETDFGQMCKKTVIRRLASVCAVETITLMHNYEGERDLKDITPEPIREKVDPVQEMMNQEKVTTPPVQPQSQTLEGTAVRVEEEPAKQEGTLPPVETVENNQSKEFQLENFRLTVLGKKGRKQFKSFEEIHKTLKDLMIRQPTKIGRETLLKENIPLFVAMDKINLSDLVNSLYKLKDQGE